MSILIPCCCLEHLKLLDLHFLSNGSPSSRMVLLKKYNNSGFSFATNYRSRKASDIVCLWHIMQYTYSLSYPLWHRLFFVPWILSPFIGRQQSRGIAVPLELPEPAGACRGPRVPEQRSGVGRVLREPAALVAGRRRRLRPVASDSRSRGTVYTVFTWPSPQLDWLLWILIFSVLIFQWLFLGLFSDRRCALALRLWRSSTRENKCRVPSFGTSGPWFVYPPSYFD